MDPSNVTMTSAPLLSLPEELVAAIAGSVDIEDLLNASLSCRTLHRCTKGRLAANAVLHETYSILHDRRPLTAPSLLRLAFDDPEAAWHIRTLEFWGLRPGWVEPLSSMY